MPNQTIVPNFTVRLATESDLACLTTLHCKAFRPEEHIPVMLGKQYVMATYRWLITSSEAYCLVADCDSKIIGLVSVCDTPFTRPMFFACLPEFIQSLLRSPHLILQKRLWSRFLRRTEMSAKASSIVSQPGFAQLIVIAVDQEWRGAGVFRSLIEAAKSYSKTRGSGAIQAGVYKFNQPSQRAFAKNGWIEIPELETTDTVCYAYSLDPHFLHQLGIAGSRDN